MKKSLIAAAMVGMLTVAGCGSDSGGGPGGAQGEAAEAAIAEAEEQGIELDEDCVNELAGELSDEDAEAIVAAGPDGDADISAEGTAIGARLLGCADQDAIVDEFITQLQSSGQEFDEGCVRENLEDVDLAGIAAEGGEDVPSELVDAVFECFDIGG